ncbi:arsenite-transporting ATPase [Bacillus ectoiniformans]|uniref:arsenical pump-driving ATPase n=1 Tax=Bacillus ectoiniformans TaxID=1494429 RepID=UPI00195B09F2|nr:arsenical pump-driving ATPase [Bacillus ectoiniformans]MBM7647389.1 arsenite-transporting ATPase [Bacillus ectoiniformans]
MFPLFNPDTSVQTPFLFFTGKGGVGKTTAASSTAVALADAGKKVLIVSTDPASNLQDVFEVELSNDPKPVQGVANLFACNLDPEEAARSYRDKIIGPYKDKLPDSVVASMEEQLSGACTVEIAAFDEFTNLLSNEELIRDFDHIIFDTAPTGHTLRLLQLPNAWTDFLEDNTHGASCLGPLSGLSAKKDLYAKTVKALSNPDQTTLILVARPDASSLAEADRAANELKPIGLKNQVLIINGLMENYKAGDPIAEAFHQRQQKAIEKLPSGLNEQTIYYLPYVSFSITGIQQLRRFSSQKDEESPAAASEPKEDLVLPGLKAVVDDLSESGKRVIFTMGKGGVGKTTVAAAIAVGLSEKAHRVHLTTTDPAAHLDYVMGDRREEHSLSISRIDPKQEVDRYKQEVLNQASPDLDEEGLAYLEEDLNSPCTEEIAIFRAFADVVAKADEEIVVIDTAPTGHTLLLLDSTETYHKEMERSTGNVSDNVKKLLPRLRNPEETGVIIVTLAETTPVLEAERLQQDLKRAAIQPAWWVINQSLYATNTSDPILAGRAASEMKWIRYTSDLMPEKTAIIRWAAEEKIGYDQMKELIL